MKLFKSLFPILLFSLLIGTAYAEDKLVTTMSGRSYYNVFDEDAMGSDSATGVPTQQSVKAYVDSGSGTLTNKTLTSPVINTGVSGTAVLDDDTMGTATSTTIPSAESVKAYVDSSVAPNTKFVNVNLANISASGSAYVTMPVTGTLTRSTGVLSSSITGVDSKINLSAYGSALGTMTVYSSSAAGTVSYVVPSAISVARGQAITLQSYGSSTGAAALWTTLEVTPTATVLSKYVVGEITDVSSGGSSWVTAPVAGTIENIWTVIDGAISGSDDAITFKIATVLVTGSAITIANGSSAAGDVDTSAPTALNTVTQGQAIEMITDGASTGTVKAMVVFEILPN